MSKPGRKPDPRKPKAILFRLPEAMCKWIRSQANKRKVGTSVIAEEAFREKMGE